MYTNLAVDLLDTKHITNVDQEKVTETYVFLTGCICFLGNFARRKGAYTHAVKVKTSLLRNDQ